MPRDIYALVLAAGQSKRYGKTKLLADLHGRPLLQHALAAGQKACPGRVCLVTGHEADEINSAASGLADIIVLNSAYESGVGSSIAIGAAACREQADAVIVMLADQPLITAAHISRIIKQWSGGPDEIVATRFSGVDGPPVLFGKGYFDQLEALAGDAGAKSLLLANPAAVRTVSLEQAAIDIDTPRDLAALLSRD